MSFIMDMEEVPDAEFQEAVRRRPVADDRPDTGCDRGPEIDRGKTDRRRGRFLDAPQHQQLVDTHRLMREMLELELKAMEAEWQRRQ